jgi:hypothetical protein
MIHNARRSLFKALWWLWLLCTAFVWLFWLTSLPEFFQRAAAGTLPTIGSTGSAIAQMAVEGTVAWGVSVSAWAWINTIITAFIFLVFTIIAILIWYRVRTGFGLLTAYILLLGSASMDIAVSSAEHSAVILTIWQLGAVIWLLFFPWLYLFPNGRAVPRRILWLLGTLFALFAVLQLLYTLATFLDAGHPLAQANDQLQPINDLLVITLFFLVLGAQVYRYIKVSNPIEKQQTKWFLLGLTFVFVPSALLDILQIDHPPELGTITFVALPLGIGISILRYRLWDIDVIIRKTLIYAMLTGLLALVYLGSVVLLQSIVEAFSGQQSAISIVISTLLIAALFAPLRRRIQDFIDRRFYRRKYDAEQTLDQFAQTASQEVELDALSAELLQVVRDTMQPDLVSLWLKPEKSNDFRTNTG